MQCSHSESERASVHAFWRVLRQFGGRFGAHTAIVNDLCFDKQGECIASCSDDGTVVLNGLYSAECESFTYQRPVKVRGLDTYRAAKFKGFHVHCVEVRSGIPHDVETFLALLQGSNARVHRIW